MDYSKKCILTPTFSGHFQFIKKYLKSFDMYVEDKDFPIFFIISKEDLNGFEKIISPYNHLNITTLVFDDLLKANGIEKTPQ